MAIFRTLVAQATLFLALVPAFAQTTGTGGCQAATPGQCTPLTR